MAMFNHPEKKKQLREKEAIRGEDTDTDTTKSNLVVDLRGKRHDELKCVLTKEIHGTTHAKTTEAVHLMTSIKRLDLG